MLCAVQAGIGIVGPVLLSAVESADELPGLLALRSLVDDQVAFCKLHSPDSVTRGFDVIEPFDLQDGLERIALHVLLRLLGVASVGPLQ